MACFNNKILIQSNSWDEFRSSLALLDNKAKGDAFEKLVFYYLKLHPEYATKLQDVWLLKDVPYEISKDLNLPRQDEGIDILLRTKDEEFWAVQCKYREDVTHSLTRKELSTFTDLAFGICKGISLALVCTTADRFSHKLELYENKISFCAGDKWRELDNDFFIRLHRYLTGDIFLPKPLKPREHQASAIKNAEKHFIHEKNTRGKMIMPCGTGKSLAAYWIAEKLKSNSILVAVPSLSLIQQTLGVWTKESYANKKDIRWICVCSDETVREFEKDDMAVLVQDLGVHVYTDTEEIANWLKNNSKCKIVVITTYQSGKTISVASKKAKMTFDLGIFDEAHNTAGRKDSLFSHLICDNNIIIKHRMFMTATERRYLGSSEEIASMEDPLIYGDTFEMLSFKAAVERTPPILSDYKIVTINVGRTELARLVEKNLYVRPDKGKWDKDIEAGMLAAAIALRKAMHKYPIKHAVSFHSSISRSIAFKETQDILTDTFDNEYGHLDTFHVSGSTPTAVRKNEIDCFEKSDKALITNARCLTEGVDVPNIDCVLFADPRGSKVDIVQAVGRALRPYPGKKFGYVIVPILVDDEKDFEINLGETGYESLISTLRALAANDERIIEYFRTISGGQKPSGKNMPVDIDIPLGVEIDANRFLESIELKCWSRLAKLSWRPFDEARAFVHELKLKKEIEWRAYCKGEILHNNCLPPDIPTNPHRTYAGKGWKNMGDWLGTGRIADRLKKFRSFLFARAFVRKLKLKSQKEWFAYTQGEMPHLGKLPVDIPANPHGTYAAKGWKGFGDWLGTGTIASYLREYRTFDEARTFVRKLNLKSQKEWIAYSQGKISRLGRLPDDIPKKPDGTYADKGWKGMGDWLGTGTIAPSIKTYRPFPEARSFARKLKLKSQNKWLSFARGQMPHIGQLPADIPIMPYNTYADKGWKGMGDWLGTGNIANHLKEYRSFPQARSFAKKLKLKNENEWRDFARSKMPHLERLPNNIPAAPEAVYSGKGWKGYCDWLGTHRISPNKKEYRSFHEARAFARALKLKSRKEWSIFCKGQMEGKSKLPVDIPAYPEDVYAKKGWKSVGDWLGTGVVATRSRRYLSFQKARKFARSLRLKTGKEWVAFSRGDMSNLGRLPKDIPAYPSDIYVNKGWKGTGDWLGAPFRKGGWRSYDNAKSFVHKLKLKSMSEWNSFCHGKMKHLRKRPLDIPIAPSQVYSGKGWKGMGDWLGTGTIAPNQRIYRPFVKARNFARNLSLRNQSEWTAYCKGERPDKGSLPKDIPLCPWCSYKNKGWKGIGDWLGSNYIPPSQRVYRPFIEARAFVHKLNLKHNKEWRRYCAGDLQERGQIPSDIPSNPNLVYSSSGWKGFGDWLGTGAPRATIIFPL